MIFNKKMDLLDSHGLLTDRHEWERQVLQSHEVSYTKIFLYGHKLSILTNTNNMLKTLIKCF